MKKFPKVNEEVQQMANFGFDLLEATMGVLEDTKRDIREGKVLTENEFDAMRNEILSSFNILFQKYDIEE